MSDEEDIRDVGGDDELGLPKATISKLIAEYMPKDFSCAKDAKDLMAECCKEFVLAVSSEANEICEKGSKKTMAPEHIIQALKALGFDKMVEQVQDASDTQKETAKDLKQRKAKKAKGNGMTEEEMIKAQEALFAASRARLESGAPPPPPSATEPKPEPDTQPDV